MQDWWRTMMLGAGNRLLSFGDERMTELRRLCAAKDPHVRMSAAFFLIWRDEKRARTALNVAQRQKNLTGFFAHEYLDLMIWTFYKDNLAMTSLRRAIQRLRQTATYGDWRLHAISTIAIIWLLGFSGCNAPISGQSHLAPLPECLPGLCVAQNLNSTLKGALPAGSRLLLSSNVSFGGWGELEDDADWTVWGMPDSDGVIHRIVALDQARTRLQEFKLEGMTMALVGVHGNQAYVVVAKNATRGPDFYVEWNLTSGQSVAINPGKPLSPLAFHSMGPWLGYQAEAIGSEAKQVWYFNPATNELVKDEEVRPNLDPLRYETQQFVRMNSTGIVHYVVDADGSPNSHIFYFTDWKTHVSHVIARHEGEMYDWVMDKNGVLVTNFKETWILHADGSKIRVGPKGECNGYVDFHGEWVVYHVYDACFVQDAKQDVYLQRLPDGPPTMLLSGNLHSTWHSISKDGILVVIPTGAQWGLYRIPFPRD